MRKTLLSIASLLLVAGNINATNIGYSKDEISRNNVFRLGSTEKQGQAMRLSHAKLQALKGKTIDFAEFVLGSKNVTDKKMHVFLTKQLDGTPIAEMSEDPTYIFFYPNTSSTFAPAAMVNRNTYANVSTTPIVNATDVNSLLSTIYYADTKEPYVSLYLKTTLDESTRELNVKLYVLPHKTVPHNSSIFNVYLVQDGIEARQASGGDNYIHNRTFRGTVTGNAWGLLVKDIKAGQLLSWEKTITIPESIHSTYYADETKNNVEAVLKNMSVVAYIGEFDQNDNNKHTIYNCCEARLGESYKQTGFVKPTDVNSAEAEQSVSIFVSNGKVHVGGEYDRLQVYNLAGAQVENADLAKGVYIVKVTADGKQTTKKVLVK